MVRLRHDSFFVAHFAVECCAFEVMALSSEVLCLAAKFKQAGAKLALDYDAIVNFGDPRP